MAIVSAILILTIAILLYRREHALKEFFWPAFAVRVLGGIALGLVYTWYYPVADTFAYFDDGRQLATLAREDLRSYMELLLYNKHLDDAVIAMTQPRALFLSKMTSVLNLITGDTYWIAVIYFALVSFLGAWVLVKEIYRYFPSVRNAALIAFLFLPSVVFWTGGLLKEAPAMAALWFLSAIFLRVWFGDRVTWWQYAVAIISFWVFWNLKYYYAGIFIAVVAATFLCRFIVSRRSISSATVEVALWMLILLIPVALVSLAHPNFHFNRLLHVIVENNALFEQLSAPGDFVQFYHLRPSAASMMINAPLALFSGLFRPFLWEASGLPQLFASAENAVLLVLLIAATARMRTYASSPHRLLILCSLAFVAMSAIFITLSSPNFGTLSRFRCGYLSFFTFITLCNNPLLQYVERSFRLVRH